MRVIIAGGRNVTDEKHLFYALHQCTFPITEVVSGGARGADYLGENHAICSDIDLTVFPADWGTYGKRAGVIRNIQMAEYADALIALWDGKSRGTQHMIETMQKQNKPIFVYRVDQA